MRDYAKVSPQIWIGETGKKLRGNLEAQVVALYLMTNPHANMTGLYYLPQMFLQHETGIPLEGASKGLARCIETGFCGYDEQAEVVWVKEMARFQVSDQLKPEDKRCAGIQNEYNSVPENKYLGEFFERYSVAFHMVENRGASKGHGRGLKAPPKPRAGTRAGAGTGIPAADDSANRPSLKVTWTDTGFEIPTPVREGFAVAFPAVSLEAEIAKAHAWVLANPKNRKSEWGRFLNNWLQKAQNSAPRVQTETLAGSQNPIYADMGLR